MKGKFFIFVVIVGATQGSLAELPIIVDGLTEDELVGLNQIISNQEAALAAKFEGLNPLFDVFQRSASSLIYNTGHSVSLDDVSTFFQARSSMKKAMDYSMDAVQIAVGGGCSAVEEARSATHANLDGAYEAAIAGMFLAVSGLSSAILRAALLNDLRSLGANVKKAIDICLDTKEGNVLDVVQQAEGGSGRALDQVTHAIFNAIDGYAAAVSAGGANVSLISTIECFRQQALDGLRSDVESKYSGLRKIFIHSKLKQTKMLSGLASEQFPLTVATREFAAMAEAIYETIFTCLDTVFFGFTYAGRPDLTDTDEHTKLV